MVPLFSRHVGPYPGVIVDLDGQCAPISQLERMSDERYLNT